jgi:hypothetical protein
LGEVFFWARQGESGFVYRVREDGTGLRKAIEQPVSQLDGVSADGNWVVAWHGISMAYPTGNGSPFPIFGTRPVRVRWSADRRYLAIQSQTSGAGGIPGGGTTYVVPLPPGRMWPQIPEGGFRSADDIAKLPGARVIEAPDAWPGPTLETYAFSRETTQRNLYRIPIP